MEQMFVCICHPKREDMTQGRIEVKQISMSAASAVQASANPF